MIISRRIIVLGGASLCLGGCFDRPCEERNPAQRAFLDGLRALSKPALENLKAALLIENDDPFTWYEAAQAYSNMGNEPMADLATAERYYAVGAYAPAAMFANKARHGLDQGSPDWQRANDIVAISMPLARQQQQR